MNPVKLMIIDADQQILHKLEPLLSEMGYQVACLVDRREDTLEQILHYTPDLLLVGKSFISSSQNQTLILTLAHDYHLPIIFVTDSIEQTTLHHTTGINPVGYLTHPFEKTEIFPIIEIALARSQAQLEVRKALAKEQELNELKSRLITMISHYFRTPLSTIVFSAGLLNSYGYQCSEDKLKVHLDRIQSGAKSLTDLLDKILVFSKAESREIPLQIKPINIHQFCLELQEEIKTLYPLVNLKLTLAHPMTEANLDPKIIKQILLYVLVNSIQYSHPETPIYLSVKQTKNQVIFNIIDHGIGIPVEDRSQIFDLFHRGSNVGSIPGTGLGLSIVQQLLELHQGSIFLQSELNVGTTVTLCFAKNGLPKMLCQCHELIPKKTVV
ncbi:hybrid sensor histidine kinase/response regulator [Spirulina subsalsa FACHB-351]|uniref:histidine kinase n=1 Tax=Spirulina subsalsa FACHB-351 TaxID=234711 RepID=A0ABT3L0P8_9CYAN|nr:hybrid sensor histidine kinase/response regulator [Spirulina subsalsa]MCW6035057.1 hybrid sensor histidine kinase/response regulator [Spirulina subsalsa FACHB-351]